MVFVCSTETFDYGKKLVETLGHWEIVAEQFEGFDITKHITSDVDSINLVLGPGRFEMSLGLVEANYSPYKKSPILWVTHQRLTKSKNVIGEQLVDIGKINEKSAFVRFQDLLVKFLEFKTLRKFMKKNWFGITKSPNLHTKF